MIQGQIRYTLRQLSYFVSVGEFGSVTVAAQKLNVSQPSISAAISKLEHVFGVQLFVRHHAQGLSLTRAGEQLMAEANRILHEASQLSAAARDLGGSPSGQIQVGCFQTFGPFFMPGLLWGFRQSYPRIEVVLRDGHYPDLIPALEAGKLDALLLWDNELDPLPRKEILAEAPPFVVLPPSDPLARGASVSLHDLVDKPMVLLDLLPSSEYFCSLFEEHGLQPNVTYRTNSIEMLRGMVGHGFGYSILVTRPAGDRSYDGKPLVYLPIKENVRPSRIVLKRFDTAWPMQTVDSFAKHCREYFRTIAESVGYFPPGSLDPPRKFSPRSADRSAVAENLRSVEAAPS